MKFPEHNVEYETVKSTYEQYVVTLGQVEAVRKRITAPSPRLKLVRKITRAAGKPSIYLPPEIVKEADLKIGQEVEVSGRQEKKRNRSGEVTEHPTEVHPWAPVSQWFRGSNPRPPH